MVKRPSIRLPRQWPQQVKSGVLHAISLASVVLTYARGQASGHRQLTAKLEQAETEIALLREELSIKDGRWERSRSRRRPHYTGRTERIGRTSCDFIVAQSTAYRIDVR